MSNSWEVKKDVSEEESVTGEEKSIEKELTLAWEKGGCLCGKNGLIKTGARKN